MNKEKVICSVNKFNKILEECGVKDRVEPEERGIQYPESAYIEIWYDGSVYLIDSVSKTSHDIYYEFFETEEEWKELQKEIHS